MCRLFGWVALEVTELLYLTNKILYPGLSQEMNFLQMDSSRLNLLVVNLHVGVRIVGTVWTVGLGVRPCHRRNT